MGQKKTGQDLALLCLRIGLGVLFIVYGWGKISNVGGVVGMWEKLHLFAPPLLGPVHAVVEFGGGILLIAGLLTRLVGLLLAIDMIGALVIVKIPATQFAQRGGWSLEWQALWIALALLAGGGGAFSLDGLLRNVRGRRRAEPAPTG
jgi:putative oxidoreductase